MIITLTASAAAAAPSLPLQESFEIRTPTRPLPVWSDGRSMIAFEIHATNFSNQTLSIRSVRILQQDGSEIGRFDGEALGNRIKLLGASKGSYSSKVSTGQRAVIYIETNVPRPQSPWDLQVVLEYIAANGEPFEVSSNVELIDRTPVQVLAPPFKDGTWVAVHDPSWPRGHRRMIYTIGGQARIPGRYAVDFVGVDENGRTSIGDPDAPQDAVGYGSEVLAGADALVVAARDGMHEAASISSNPVKRLGDGSGNYVVLKLSPTRFAFYEHLQRSSVRVRPGDRVRAGQPIGALGFSGDSTGPHLHLHVANCALPLECEGEPFEIRNMNVIGRYTSISDLGTKVWESSSPANSGRPSWPGYNVVVNFR